MTGSILCVYVHDVEEYVLRLTIASTLCSYWFSCMMYCSTCTCSYTVYFRCQKNLCNWRIVELANILCCAHYNVALKDTCTQYYVYCILINIWVYALITIMCFELSQIETCHFILKVNHLLHVHVLTQWHSLLPK